MVADSSRVNQRQPRAGATFLRIASITWAFTTTSSIWAPIRSCSPPSTLRTLSQEPFDLQQPLSSKCAPTNRQRPPSEHEDLVQSSRKSPPDNYETKSDSLSELTKSGILKCVSYQPAAETLGTLMQMLTAKKYLHKRICFSASDPSIPSPWKTRMRAHRRPKEGDR